MGGAAARESGWRGWLAVKKAEARVLLACPSRKRALRTWRLSRSPVVIGGCGRSGTTLLLSLLSCHPKLFVLAEETLLLCPGSYKGMDRPPPAQERIRTNRVLARLLAEDIHAEAERWCEKTPKNVHAFPAVLRSYGRRARMIHIVRDGRDVVCSKHPTAPEKAWVSPTRWVCDVEAGLRLEGHPQVATIRYEQLVTDVESTMRGLCEFVGIDYTDAFLRYPETARVLDNVAWREPRPVSAAGVGGWRRPGKEELVEVFHENEEAVALLDRLGYTDERPGPGGS